MCLLVGPDQPQLRIRFLAINGENWKNNLAVYTTSKESKKMIVQLLQSCIFIPGSEIMIGPGR